jgi:hypothetical protein
MKFILMNSDYLNEADIIVRVYETQRAVSEKEQCAGEILFHPRISKSNVRFTAWLPRGLVEGIKNAFKTISGNFTVQISNELPDQIGVLTSCREHFDTRLRSEFLSAFPSNEVVCNERRYR